jgi:hypothetical protein
MVGHSLTERHCNVEAKRGRQDIQKTQLNTHTYTHLTTVMFGDLVRSRGHVVEIGQLDTLEKKRLKVMQSMERKRTNSSALTFFLLILLSFKESGTPPPETEEG